MKRKYESFVTWLKVNAGMLLLIGLLLIALGLAGALPLKRSVTLMLGLVLMGGALNTVMVAAIIELLSDIEFSTRKPGSKPSLEEATDQVFYSCNPYTMPHAINIAETEKRHR